MDSPENAERSQKANVPDEVKIAFLLRRLCHIVCFPHDLVASEVNQGQVINISSFRKEQTLYLFHLVIDEYYENYEPLKAFVTLIANFSLHTHGVTLVIPSTGSYADTRRELLALAWDEVTLYDLNQTRTPLLLITRTELDHFDPKTDDFLILKFPAALDPAEHSQYVDLFAEMSSAIEAGDDLFAWKRAEARKQTKHGLLQRLYDSIELKPGVAGCSVDLKKLLVGK